MGEFWSLDGKTEMADLLIRAARYWSRSSSYFRAAISFSLSEIAAYLSAILREIDDSALTSTSDSLFWLFL